MKADDIAARPGLKLVSGQKKLYLLVGSKRVWRRYVAGLKVVPLASFRGLKRGNKDER